MYDSVRKSPCILLLLIITLIWCDTFLEQVRQPPIFLAVVFQIQSGPTLGFRGAAEQSKFPQV